MKSKRLFTIFFLLIFSHLFSQTTFQKTWGGTGVDYAYDMHKAPAGGYYFGGVTNSWVNSTVASYIVRTNDNGDTLWTIAYGASDTTCNAQYINDICPTTDGGCIAVGGKTVCGNPNAGGNIVRVDANGNIMWAKYCSQNEDPYPVIQDNAGNFIVGGYVTGIGAGGQDACLMKLDANGDTLWSKTYGGSGNDWFYHIVQTSDGGYLAAGFTSSFGQGNNDVYLVKTDVNGNLQWSKAYGTANYESAFGHSLEKTNDGGYILAGQGDVVASAQGFFLMKTDASGTMSWAKYYDGRYAHAVKQTPDHGYAVGGTSGNGIELLKTDSLGNLQWNKNYSGRKGLILELANDGGYVTGGQENFTGLDELMIIKTDANGNSGCNETTPVVNATIAPFITVNCATQVFEGANTVGYPLLFARGGMENDLCSTVGINNPEKIIGLKLFPNPSSNFVTVQSTTELGLITIYNSLGEIVYRQTADATEQQIDVSKFSSGIYFLQAQNTFIKIVKE